jgi:hypothetical protein
MSIPRSRVDWATVGPGNIVVYCFGYANDLHFETGVVAVLSHQLRAAHRAVAAHEDQVSNFEPAQIAHHAVQIVCVGLEAGGTEQSARAVPKKIKLQGRHLPEFDNLSIDQSLDTEPGAKNPPDLLHTNCFRDGAGQAGIEDGCGAASLHDHQIARAHIRCLPSSVQTA